MELEQDPAASSQRDVIFEDIDLLAFSEGLTETRSQVANMQGSPLKAVYRDSIVGIRYLHPRHSATAVTHLPTCSSNPTSHMLQSYRRFQINFASSADTEQFIDAIRPVCPCKLNGPPPPAALARNATMHPTRPPLAVSSSFLQAPVRRATAHPSTLTMPQTQVTGPAYTRPVPADKAAPSSSSGLSICTSSASSVLPTNSDTSGLPTPVSAATRGPSAYTQTSQHILDASTPFVQDRPPPVRRNSARDISALMHGSGGSSSLPSSSPPSSAVGTMLPSSDAGTGSMLPPPVPVPAPAARTHAHVQPAKSTDDHESPSCFTLAPRPPAVASTEDSATRAAFVASLRDAADSSSLCDLSRAELEGLVSHVVREPGFGKLLETLDSMWVVKGFLAR
ncbi:hypothetical protein DENSPDRAFT_842963 [Dentipellis sp. KUC8613]|nr:hypothetical protein DENSPDRAFT_842963 [Dentipellis sp. KUC8613]